MDDFTKLRQEQLRTILSGGEPSLMDMGVSALRTARKGTSFDDELAAVQAPAQKRAQGLYQVLSNEAQIQGQQADRLLKRAQLMAERGDKATKTLFDFLGGYRDKMRPEDFAGVTADVITGMQKDGVEDINQIPAYAEKALRNRNVQLVPKEVAPSELGKLIAERDALPAGHPSRGLYDQKIEKLTAGSAGLEVDVPGVGTIRVGGTGSRNPATDLQAEGEATANAMRAMQRLAELAASEGPKVMGAAGSMASFIESFGQQARAVGQQFGLGAIDQRLTGGQYDFGNFADTAAKNAVFRSRLLDMAYAIARANEPGARALTEADIQRSLKIIGSAQSPAQLIATLNDLGERQLMRYEIGSEVRGGRRADRNEFLQRFGIVYPFAQPSTVAPAALENDPQAQAIRDRFKRGEITREQARAELEKLGVQ